MYAIGLHPYMLLGSLMRPPHRRTQDNTVRVYEPEQIASGLSSLGQKRNFLNKIVQIIGGKSQMYDVHDIFLYAKK